MDELKYFDEIHTENAIYSIDKLNIEFHLMDEVIRHIEENEHYLSECSGMHLVDYYKRRLTNTYRYIGEYAKDVIISIRIIVDLCTGENKCYLDCNPNKSFNNEQCVSDIEFLLSNSHDYIIKMLDVAVDIPVTRGRVSVNKDRRVMIVFITSKSDHGTIYLGKKRHSIGRVKVYDKQKESGLPNGMTRVEITMGNPLESGWTEMLRKKLPNVYIQSKHTDINLESEHLSSTDRVLIKALNQHNDKINLLHHLDFKKRKKLEEYVLANENRFVFDVDAMVKIALKISKVIQTENAVVDGEKFVNHNQSIQ